MCGPKRKVVSVRPWIQDPCEMDACDEESYNQAFDRSPEVILAWVYAIKFKV